MVTPQDIKRWIEQGLEAQQVETNGDGHHFEATVVSAAFRGRTRVQQHQLVYAALGERMKAEIHALSLRTFTPEEWAQRGV
jgi:acid stress-induced BolA-like protein IbaG/YrbA